MNKSRIGVSAGTYQRVVQNQYSIIKVHHSVVLCVGDLLLIESDFKHQALYNIDPVVREIIDIDFGDLLFEGSDYYDVFVRNNNWLS